MSSPCNVGEGSQPPTEQDIIFWMSTRQYGDHPRAHHFPVALGQ